METMKRKWGKPVTEVQQFEPKEYVALCIKATSGGLYGAWEDTNGVPGMQQTSVSVATNDTGSLFYPYIGVADGHYNSLRDTYIFDKDKQYKNEDGWLYIQLEDNTYPKSVREDPDFNKQKPAENDWWFWKASVEDGGHKFYMHWKPGREAYTNHS